MSHVKINKVALAVTVTAALAFAGSAGATTYLETGSIVDFTVPTTGRYEIAAWGAEGGSALVGSPAVDRAAGGIGAEVGGEFNLVSGHTVEILVGEQGANGYYPSGGGGTFVYDLTASTLILAAGAGGGGNDSSATTTGIAEPGGNAPNSTSGGAGGTTLPGPVGNSPGGAGGTNGGGGAVGNSSCCGGGGGGGGFSGNGGGAGYDGNGGTSFLNGGQQFVFGGGGQGVDGGSGGGGGYSGGGGGGTDGIGGGGGSYVNGALLVAGTALPFADAVAPADPQSVPYSASRNDGEVIIGAVTSAAPEPSSWALMIGGLGLVGSRLRRRRSALVRGAA